LPPGKRGDSIKRELENILPEKTSHIFICFSSSDEAVAREVVRFLEAAGLNCWISLRDIAPGQNYQETIIKALEKAMGVVFLFSTSSGASPETKKELSVAGSLNTPVFPLRLSPIAPIGALRYELATRQWLDIFPDREQAFRRLVETIREVLDEAGRPEGARAEATPMAAVPMAAAPMAAVPMAAAPSVAPGAPAPPAPTPPAPTPPKRRSRARAPIIAPGSQEFEAIRILLARHIGPIAKVYVQKAAIEARTPDDLCEQLAARVSAPSDRAAFLRAARARLATKS